ncbi:MAG TPA: hypothetical protein VL426_06020 [Candidatus Binatia bacterium]|nr:hypothetical protein [Candidatus Binatia bacterium]
MPKSIRHMEWGGGGARCTGKRTYKSEAAARRTADDQERRGSPPLTVYHCPDCAGFHLTKRPG